MIELRNAVRQINDAKLEIMQSAFRNASTGTDAHLSFVKSVGVVQGLEIALDIILAVTRGDENE